MYELEKISLAPHTYSRVSEGHRQESDDVYIFLAGNFKTKKIKNIQGIKVGYQVLMAKGSGYLQTSAVQEILESGEDWIRFRTMTSVYELRKL